MTLCPGLGDKKVMNLYDALHSPFFTSNRSTSAANEQPDNDNDDSAAADVDVDEAEV
jgi:hypothetical protein